MTIVWFDYGKKPNFVDEIPIKFGFTMGITLTRAHIWLNVVLTGLVET